MKCPGGYTSSIEGRTLPEPGDLNDNCMIVHLPAYPRVNSYLQRRIRICYVHSSDDAVSGQMVRSNFVSDANMIVFVFGNKCYIISRSGRYAEASAFSQEVGRMEGSRSSMPSWRTTALLRM